MFDTVMTNLDQVTPEWLTAVLSRDGALARGQVAAFEVQAGGGNWSSNGVLRLRYSDNAQGSLPERLFLKMVDADLGDGEYFGPSEVTYYTRDYLGVPDAPLIRCYHAAYSPELQRYHLLLDDLSETHIAATDLTPTLDYGLALAEALAALHAPWWGAAKLAQIDAPVHSPAHLRRFVEIAQPGVGHIVARFTADLAPHWPALIQELFAHHPQALIARMQDDNGFTLIHGDAGCTNILVPRQGVRPLYLIDRQPFDWSLTTWLGVYDLAYAMVLDWEVEARRSLEIPVLKRYQEALVQRGVSGYPWERLWDDYRLCAAMGVYIATEYCRGGVNERYTWVWLPMLQRALTACDDLDCQALWQPGRGDPPFD
jgi:hypothetical protein